MPSTNQKYLEEATSKRIQLWLEGKHDGRRGKTATCRWIRDYMLQKHNHKCSRCGWGELNPHTGLIPLELEHIDGDFTNNKEENLDIVCPNCHSLTPTYKGANKNPGRPRAKYYRGT